MAHCACVCLGVNVWKPGTVFLARIVEDVTESALATSVKSQG